MSRRHEAEREMEEIRKDADHAGDIMGQQGGLICTLADEVDAERAVITELKQALEIETATAHDAAELSEAWANAASEANATLDALREALQRQGATLFYVTASKALGVGFDAQPETTDDVLRWPSGAPFTAEDAHHGLTGE